MVDLHPNTVRNWRKTGKLKTAEKVLENNVDTWVVDPQEVHQLVQASRSTNWMNNRSYTVNIPDGQPNQEQVTQASPTAISLVQEQTIAFMRESVVKPLVEANDRHVVEIGSLKEEVGTLKERLRYLEAQLQAAIAVVQPPVAPVAPPPADITPIAGNAPQPVKKGFWQRMFGG